MAPRFLIDENLSPMLAYATAEDRVIVTNNADDFRRLERSADRHPGLTVLLQAVGRQQQIELGTARANAVETVAVAGGTTHGWLFEVDVSGRVRNYRLP